ncbi:unnamed protein product [Urochloa decumbens]|uniref:Uncharacterized protein n=1 Tax=Urochloa decumbens TaxID=240449 RepID=A0ABC9DBE3_9POAL
MAMSLFRRSVMFAVGIGCGVYAEQNYNMPNVKRLFNAYVFLAKYLVESNRKPKKDE